jgi:hypothetical protein
MPTLWTPRAGPWWRLPRWDALFTSGKFQRGSTGKLKRGTATGKMRKNSASDTTCCCPCGACGDSVDITFSGVVMCTACFNGGGEFYRVTAGTLDGSYTLPKIVEGTNCTYQLNTTGPTVGRWTFSATCAGAPNFQSNDLDITVRYTLAGTLQINASGAGAGNYSFFDSTDAGVGVCVAQAVNNDQLACGVPIRVGHSGTATVTP